MKKIFALLLTLLLLTGTASAEVDLSLYTVTNASVQAVHHVDLTAPCAGTLMPFDVEPGDTVRANDELFSLLTMDIYAAEDGKISAVFVEPGDDAAAAMNRYGCLGAMDGEVSQLMTCTTAESYESDEAKTLHIGEMLYFQSYKNNGDKGTGRVIAVTPTNYTVEILEGKFSLNERMSLYRDSGYANRDCVGKGTVMQRMPLTFTGTGIVTEVYVKPGDQVKAGDRILTLLPGVTDRQVSTVIVAPGSGIVGSVAAAPGQQVWKGAMLCRIFLTDEMEIVAEVDEMDLSGLSVGSQVYLTVDTAKKNVMIGRVTEISSMGVIRGNAAYYTVHVSLPQDQRFMLGQSASLYLPKN